MFYFSSMMGNYEERKVDNFENKDVDVDTCAVSDGAEKIIPTKRIDYITPSGLSGETGHTSYFHSYWLTKGFNLGKSETFVELTKKMKENI